MSWVEDFDNGQGQGPMWIKGHPIYGTTLLIIIHCVCLVSFSLLMALRYGAPQSALVFNSFAVVNGEVWRLFTYPFVQEPSLWFALEMLMLYWFGKDVEKFVGRKAYFGVYLALILLPSMFLTILPKSLGPQMLAGSSAVHFSIFVAFATIYPHALMFGRIFAKHIVYIYLAIFTLIYLAAHDWSSLFVFHLSCGIAFCGMKLSGVQGGFDWWNEQRTKAQWKKMERKRQVQVAQETEVNESIDPILEKISKQGMNSLTDSEKRTLERARSALLKKDKEK
jgi:membrane associated rhomboid family serine protease